jgi:zinc transport system substrate-binding protein
MKRSILLALLAAGCSDNGSGGQPEERDRWAPITVVAVNDPLRYFAERIGGNLVQVEMPAPEGEDPAYWKPAPEDVARFQKADLILLNGAGYAGWVATATLPGSRTFDTSYAIRERFLEADSVTHSHGPQGAHSHGTTAFTTWLDVSLAVEQAAAVQEALARSLSGHESVLQSAFQNLEKDLAALDAGLKRLAVQHPSVPLLASHPVYQYAAHRYGWNLQSLHWEPDEEPGPEEWNRLKQIRAQHPAAVMLWEADPLPETAARLRQMGVEPVLFDPCGGASAERDFVKSMRANLDRLSRALDSR